MKKQILLLSMLFAASTMHTSENQVPVDLTAILRELERVPDEASSGRASFNVTLPDGTLSSDATHVSPVLRKVLTILSQAQFRLTSQGHGTEPLGPSVNSTPERSTTAMLASAPQEPTQPTPSSGTMLSPNQIMMPYNRQFQMPTTSLCGACLLPINLMYFRGVPTFDECPECRQSTNPRRRWASQSSLSSLSSNQMTPWQRPPNW